MTVQPRTHEKLRRRFMIALAVWAPINAFWLAMGILSGAGVIVVPLLLGPFLLVLLASRFGVERLPSWFAYLLGCTPAAVFPFVDWKWPAGLLILVMIFSYEQVLETLVHLRAARGAPTDVELATYHVHRISLVMVTVDAAAAGMDPLWLLIALVALVRMGRITVTLTLAIVVVSVVTFFVTGHPARFVGLGAPELALPSDVDDWFVVETLVLGALAGWGRAMVTVWR